MNRTSPSARQAAHRRRQKLITAGVIFSGVALAAAALAGSALGIRAAACFAIASGIAQFLENLLHTPGVPDPLARAYYIEPREPEDDVPFAERVDENDRPEHDDDGWLPPGFPNHHHED